MPSEGWGRPMTRDRSARPRGPALGCARGSWAIRPERNGIGDVERMSRRTVLIDSQRVRVGYGAQRDPVLSPIGSLPPPANHDDVGLYVPEIARIFRAYGIGDGAQRRGMDGPEPEQVQKHQAGVPPSSRKTDAATQGRILCAFGGRGGIKQDESDSAVAAPPCAPQGVTVSPVRGIVGGGPDVRGRNGIHNETGSEAAIRTAQRTPARLAGAKRSGRFDCTTNAGRGSLAQPLRRRAQPWLAVAGRGRTGSVDASRGWTARGRNSDPRRRALGCLYGNGYGAFPFSRACGS